VGYLIDQIGEQVGSVKSFLRPSSAVALFDGWAILDGSVLVDPDSAFNGLTLPDVRDTFMKGHPTLTNLNFAADLTYHIGVGGSLPSGGTDQHNLAHTHPGGSHTHSVAGHQHSITASPTHTHTQTAHTHSISTDGSHTHGYVGGGGTFSGSAADRNVAADGSHDHTGATGSGGTGATGGDGAHDHGALTGTGSGSSGVASGNTDSALTIVDNEPPWIGFVWILKFR